MLAIAARLDPEDAIIGNLHDELLLEVRAERAPVVSQLVQTEMEGALGGMLSGVPVKAEPGIYNSWAKEPTDQSCTAAINVGDNDQSDFSAATTPASLAGRGDE